MIDSRLVETNGRGKAGHCGGGRYWEEWKMMVMEDELEVKAWEEDKEEGRRRERRISRS